MPDPQIQYPAGYQPYMPVSSAPPPPPSSGQVQYPTNYEPYTPLPPVEPSWPQAIMSNLIGTVPAIAGSVGGFFAGLGPWGAAGGGALGAGLGADLRQRYEMWQTDEYGRPLRESYNPAVTAVETGLGSFGGFTKFPGLQSGAKELIKYGAKTFGEGVGIGLVGTPLQYAAETGSFNAPLSAYATNALVSGIAAPATGFGLEYGLGKIGSHPSLPREATPSYDVPLPPSPFDVPLPPQGLPYKDQTLPGMEAFRNRPDAEYGPTPFQATPPDTIGMQQSRGFAAIDARAQQQIFELTLDRAEAQRAGDSARVLAIEQAILETKMSAEQQKRNWTLPTETPPPTFEGMPDQQPDLTGFGWRQGGRFTTAENIPPEMRQGVLGPEVTGGPRYPPATPEPPWMPPSPRNTEPPPPPPTGGGGGGTTNADFSLQNPSPSRIKIFTDQGYVQGETQPDGSVTMHYRPQGQGATPPTQENLPKYVEISNMSDHEYINRWVGRGYLPGGPISANGFPQLVRPDVAPTTIPTVPKPPAVAPTRQGAFRPGERAAGNEQIVPASIVNNEYIAKMRKGGYEIAIRGPEEVVFRRVKEPIQSRVGGGNFSPNIRQILLRIFRPNQPLNAGSMGEFELRRAVADIVQETDRVKARQNFLEWTERMMLARDTPDADVISNLADLASEKFDELSPTGEVDQPNMVNLGDPNVMQMAPGSEDRVTEGNVVYDRALSPLGNLNIKGADVSEQRAARSANLAETRRMLRGWVENLETSINDAQRKESNIMIEVLRRRERELTQGVQGELPFGPLREQPLDLELETQKAKLAQADADRRNKENAEWARGSQMENEATQWPDPVVPMDDTGIAAARDLSNRRITQEEWDRQAGFGRDEEQMPLPLQSAVEPKPTQAEYVENLLRTARALNINPDDYRSMGELAHAVEARWKNEFESMRRTDEDPFKGPIQSRIPPDAVIESFRKNLIVLEGSQNWRATRFILPDGTRLNHRGDTHEDGSNMIGIDITDAYDAGIIRFAHDGAEVFAPITDKQAEVLADAIHYTGRGTTVEVNTPKGEKVRKRFDEDSTGGEVYDWVNSHFPNRVTKPGIKSAFLDRLQARFAQTDADTAQWKSMPRVGDRGKAGFSRDSVILDKEGKITKDEVTELQSNQVLVQTHSMIDMVIDKIIELVGDPKLKRSIVRTGTLLDPRALAEYLPHPTSLRETAAILINTPEHLKLRYPEDMARAMMTTIYHELAHAPMLHTPKPVDVNAALADPYVGRFVQEYLEQQAITQTPVHHAADWLDRMVHLYERTGQDLTAQFEDEFRQIFGGSNERLRSYNPEIQRILSIYSKSRGREGTRPDIRAGEAIKSTIADGPEGTIPRGAEADGDGTTPRPGFVTRVKQATGWGQGSTEPPKVSPNKPNIVQEAINFPTNATTIDDLSFPGRQGLSQIFTPEFWKSIVPSLSAGSRSRADVIDAQLKNKELFQDRVDVMTGEVRPSIAKEAGLDLMALGHRVGPREEATSSRWIENGAFLGPKTILGAPNPFRFLYNHTLGYPARASNRIFTTFGNHLRANRFEKLMNLSRNMAMEAESGRGPMQGILGGYQLQSGKNIGLRRDYTPEQAADLNPFFNKMRAKEIAEFVNTATGRGPLKMHILPFRQTQVSLESSAKTLSMVMFAPRNTASRMRMLNPSTYIMASPFVRRQYLKAALATASAWWIFTEMAKLADPRHVKVSHDLTSADFGKVRIGDFRMDAAGGFQQFLVAYARLYQGGASSSSTGRFNEFGKGFQAQTQFDMGERLFSNKLNPVAKFAWDLAHASEYNPFHVADRSVQLFVPLIVQDFVEIQKENPDLLMPWMVPILFGAGSQIYSKGESIHKFVPPKQDWIVKGGGLIDLMPKGVQNLWDKSGRF